MLKRDIGKWGIVLLMINSIIGAGIFGLPSKIFSLTGIYSVLAIAICAVIIFIFILIFSEVGSQFNRSGGPYLYTYEAFGKLPGFIVGWLALLSRIAAFAALINLLIDYLSYLSPIFIDHQTRVISIIIISIFLFLINAISVKSSTYLNNTLGVFKLIPLTIFVVIGFFFIDFDYVTTSNSVTNFSSFSTSIFILIFAFTGWEAALVNTGEMSNPEKNIPFAMILSISFVAVFYILIQFVAIGTYPQLATSIKPIADAADLFMGSTGGLLMTIGAIISILGTLNANLLAGSRLPFALSEEGQFPKIFSRTDSKTGVPFISLTIYLAVALLVSLTGTFIYALSISVISKVITYIIVALALIKFRESRKNEGFKIPYGKVFSALGILIGVWLLYSSNHSDFIDVFIAITMGLILYFLFRIKSK